MIKVLIFSLFIGYTFGKFIHAMSQTEYNIIKDLVINDGKFRISPCHRTKEQRSGYVKYWRLKDRLSVDENGLLLYEGRRILKKGEIKKCVAKTFRKSKTAGYKKLRSRALDGYAGISRGNILKITKNDPNFRRFTVKFTNKPLLKPVIAKEVRYLK